MTLFYVLAGLIALATAALIAWPLARGRGGDADRAAREVALYREQLAEIERDLARGAIDAAEAEGARAEVSRRLLRAAERAERGEALGRAPRGVSRAVSLVAAVGLPVLGAALYLGNGMPGLPDQPLAERPPASLMGLDTEGRDAHLSQADAERHFGAPPPAELPEGLREYAELIARVEKIVEKRPDDLQGLTLLANGYQQLGRHRDAWQTWHRVIRVKGREAGAADYAALAEAMIMAAGGYVSREAREALAEAVNRDPTLPQARYFAGIALAQDGRLEEAAAIWERLVAEAPADAPWRQAVAAALAEARARLARGPEAAGGAPGAAPGAASGAAPGAASGGVAAPGAVAPGEGGPGPSAADVAAAREMSPEDRQAMIEGMVARLENRLTTEGGSPEEWVRLMNAYVQLGRRAEAERVARLALDAYAGRGEAGFIRERALVMGLEVR